MLTMRTLGVALLFAAAAATATVTDEGNGTATFSANGPNYRAVDFCMSWGWFERECSQADIADGVCAPGASVGDSWPTTTCNATLLGRNVCQSSWTSATDGGTAPLSWVIPSPNRCASLLDREAKRWLTDRARTGRRALRQMNEPRPVDADSGFGDP